MKNGIDLTGTVMLPCAVPPMNELATQVQYLENRANALDTLCGEILATLGHYANAQFFSHMPSAWADVVRAWGRLYVNAGK